MIMQLNMRMTFYLSLYMWPRGFLQQIPCQLLNGRPTVLNCFSPAEMVVDGRLYNPVDGEPDANSQSGDKSANFYKSLVRNGTKQDISLPEFFIGLDPEGNFRTVKRNHINQVLNLCADKLTS